MSDSALAGKAGAGLMETKQLAELVKRTRDAQKTYFRTKGNIAECKTLEAELDRAVKAILDPPPAGLFGESGKSAIAHGR